jgi:hypothetical protein
MSEEARAYLNRIRSIHEVFAPKRRTLGSTLSSLAMMFV